MPKIDTAALRQKINALPGLTDDERAALLQLTAERHYGLVWEERTEEAEERLRDELPVLVEDKALALLGGGSDAPNHILIEGDNLEALTALSYTHEGRVDVVYIDPPYNTGNRDFVYNDRFVDADDSYRHSKWLSFMSKRLRIAKRLLSDRGVIFISIDDNEQANLKLLCDEVFGEDKFVALIPWRKRTAKADVPHGLSQDYEWVMCYAKEEFQAGIRKDSRKYYETPDFPNRPWRVHDMSTQRTAAERPNSNFTIVNPKNRKEYPVNPLAVWRITKEGFPQYMEEHRIVFPGDYDFLKISKPVLRYWKEDDEKKAGELYGMVTASSDLPKEVGMTQDGTKDITDIFGEKAFGFPKPVSLIKHIIGIATPRAKAPTVLDFFAGSGTTMHAVMQLNKEDGGKRQCILVTNNENNICRNVTYERNRRVIGGYTTPKGAQVEGLRHNNLRYYRTRLLPRERTNRNMRALVGASTDLLCIKEGIYEELSTERLGLGEGLTQNDVRLFANGQRAMLVIYNEEAIPTIVDWLQSQPTAAAHPSEAAAATTEAAAEGAPLGAEPVKVYVFSPSAYAWDDDFAPVLHRVQLCALPDAIYQAYRSVLPKKKTQPTPIEPTKKAEED